MLEPVALNQTSFKLPGVAPDARGVLLGKLGVVLLPSFDRLVAFFRLLSEESPLDDVLPSLKLWEVRTRLGAREHLVQMQAQSSYLLDRCARAAALCGAQLFTGSGKHFVKYRDRRAPLGYDVDALLSEAADLILYADSFTQGYTRERELSFAQLLLGLELRPVPGGAPADIATLGADEPLWLTVRRGLSGKVLGYLWRNRVRAAAAVLLPELAPAEEERLVGGPPPPSLLVRIEGLPPRMLRLLASVPGVTAYAAALGNAAVELGFRHLVRLSSCASVFQKDRFYLFGGRHSGCRVLPGPPPLLPLEALLDVELQPPAPPPAERPAAPAGAPPPPTVPLRLVRGGGRRRVKAALVPWARSGWLKRLVYALPPTLLSEYQAVPIEEGMFVVSPRGIDVLPVGELFQEAAPSIFIPAGMELVPRVDPEVLSGFLGGTANRHLLLLADERQEAPRVLALAHSDFDALGRRALAPLPVQPRERLPVPRPSGERSSTLVNEPLGPLGAAGLLPLRRLGSLGGGGGEPDPGGA